MLTWFQGLKFPLKIALVIGCVLVGLIMIGLSQIKPYTLIVDGNEIRLKAVAFHADQLFALAEIVLQEDDQLSINADRFSLSLPRQITMTSARNVLVQTPQGEFVNFSPGLIPANLLAQVGFQLYPHDLILIEGRQIPFDMPLAAGQDVILEYIPAKRIDLYADGNYLHTIFTQASTYLDALEDSPLSIHPLDDTNPDLESVLGAVNRLDITRAKQICLQTSAEISCGLTPAQSVSQALSDLNLTPQGLDYSNPDGSSLLQENQHIQFHRVSERVTLVTDESNFGFAYQPDPETELDTTSVIVPGRPGILVTRTRERIVDGKIVSASEEETWQASQESDAIYGYGTLATLKSEVVDGQSIEYWRKVSVYATSYHPAEFEGDAITRSGLPLTKGIIAVSAAWYPNMAMQQVYVPGYGFGTIADSGYGIPGRYWIDLGYDDENYVGWHHQTTLYFLAPIPASYPGVLP